MSETSTRHFQADLEQLKTRLLEMGGLAEDRVRTAVEGLVRRERHRADRLGAQLDALSPLRILDRGYAVPVDPDGNVLKRRADFRPGAPFRLRVADGDVGARVESE